MKSSFILLFISFTFFISVNSDATLTPSDFLLKKYDSVAIATDLEPDDVMALKIIFDEANRVYNENSQVKYPIDLVIVGEGNTAIKRMRLEKMMKQYYNLPKDVDVQIVEGRATLYNIFPYDGQELFEEAELKEVKFNEDDKGAVTLLKDFVKKAEQPLIIQIKPANELFALSLDQELSAKTSVIFYGGFNISATLKDPEIQSLLTGKNKIEAMMQHFSDRFLKVAIIENYGVLGDESAVYTGFPWTNQISESIRSSPEEFFKIFQTLTYNWNRYILEDSFHDAIKQIDEIIVGLPAEKEALRSFFNEIKTNFQELVQNWNETLFQTTIAMSKQAITEVTNQAQALQRTIKLMEKVQPQSGLQFTFADILVALAISENHDFFSAAEIRVTCNDYGFLVPVPEPGSNTIYYNRVDRNTFADSLLEAFKPATSALYY